MTEKRFKLVEYLPNVIRIEDNHQKLNGHKIVDLLNELHEENQYLKSLKWNQDCINEISIGIQQRPLLEKENEQLKKRIQSIHTMLDNAILLERTRMGKNCLKQFKETIE